MLRQGYAMISMNVDLSSITAQLDKLNAVVNSAVRPAAQAGAQVYYNEVKLRAKRGNETRYLKGGRTRPAGLLASAIYQVFSTKNSSEQKATYHVSWNKKKAPHGYLVEFGTSRAPKHPFLRSSYDAVHGAAEAAINDELQKRIKAVL